MINNIFALFIAIAFAFGSDWLLTTRIAAFYFHDDYHYSISIQRALACVIVGSAFSLAYIKGQARQADPKVLVFIAVALAVQGWLVVRNVQKKIAAEREARESMKQE